MELNEWLIDKSAYVRLSASPDASEWLARIDSGRVQITAATRMELGYSARSSHELKTETKRPPLSQLQLAYMTPRIEGRAMEIQFLLAERGYHRAVSVPDLIIAAAADIGGLIVLHVDKDFDLIAAITGQAVERLRI